MIRRNHTYVQLLVDVCKLDENEVERLLKLNSSIIRQYGLIQRERYLIHYRNHKYEDWECREAIDLTERDLYEICEGKGQAFQLDFENMVEASLFEIGMKIAKNLALIKMTDLNYSTEDICKILGDAKTENLYPISSYPISNKVIGKMENHFLNLGIRQKRLEISVNLFQLENNLENASSITGLTLNELEKIIEDNEFFKSSSTILDSDKLAREMEIANIEIMIEAIVIDGMYDYQIEDYSNLSCFDCRTMRRLYEISLELRSRLCEFLKECSFRLMDRTFDYDEIEEITSTNIYNSVTDEYCYKNYKKHLSKEQFGVKL